MRFAFGLDRPRKRAQRRGENDVSGGSERGRPGRGDAFAPEVGARPMGDSAAPIEPRAGAPRSGRPNLVLVFADQFRRHAMGLMDEDPVVTPNFDRFARESLVFTNAVSSCPLCSPFRAMLLTGRFPLSTGVTTNCQPGLDMELSENEVCIGDVLKAAGYENCYIGKWHLENPSRNRSENPEDGATGWDAWTPPGPRRHGFDRWYAYNCSGRHFAPHYWTDSPKRIEMSRWSVRHETDVAIDFLKGRDAEKPFSLFISWNPPHPPYVAPERCKGLYAGRELPPRPNSRTLENAMPYYAAVSSCDEEFGRLLGALEELGLAEETVVMFTSDHGDMLGSHGRYGKSIWYEEAIGIPFMIRWPGRIGPGREAMPFASYDFMPTLLALMGLSVPQTVEGTDCSAVMRGEDVQRPSSAFIAYYNYPDRLLAVGQEPTPWMKMGIRLRELGIDWRTTGFRGLRTGRYTYVVNRGLDSAAEKQQAERLLYDNEADPYQMEPVRAREAKERPVMARLEEELRTWLTRTGDPFPLD